MDASFNILSTEVLCPGRNWKHYHFKTIGDLSQAVLSFELYSMNLFLIANIAKNHVPFKF